MRRHLTLFAASIIAVALASPASAQLLDFELTGSRTASFILDASPTPDFSSPFQFQLNNVPGLFGTSTVATTISFGVTPIIADFEIDGTDLGFTQFSGPMLFSGDTSAPTFLTGTFELSSIVSGSSVLTITALPAAAVPEPSSWAMMLTGLGLVGAAMRKRQRTTVRYA